jgi:hypothetical protein
MIKISASIVIYDEKEEILKKVIDSFLNIELEKELIIVDNSKKMLLKEFCESFNDTKYIFSDSNLGFARGHNLALKSKSIKSKIHLVLNPDIFFNGIDITQFLIWMSSCNKISLALPLVYNIDGTRQEVIRNIPTPLTLFKRYFNLFGIFDRFIAKDEYKNCIFKEITEIPFAHGCFMAFPTKTFEELKGFDERFFIYMEDVDIFIRAKEFGKTVVNPDFKIYHRYRKGSSKSIKLFILHCISAVKFFIKYRRLKI